MMSKAARKSLNSELANWGPPSERMRLGRPNSQKIASKRRMTADEAMEWSWRTMGNPEYLSTTTSQSLPPQWKMSVPSASMGKVAGGEGETTAAGLVGRRDWQTSHSATMLSMSLDIPGQK